MARDVVPSPGQPPAPLETPAQPERRPLRQVVGNPQFLALWPTGWAANIGRMGWLIISGYVVYSLTESVFLTQLVGVFNSFPNLLFGAFGGVIADGFSRRKVLMIDYAAAVTVAVATGLFILTGIIQPWHVLLLTLLFGVTNTLDMLSRRAYISDVVERKNLPFALALESMSMTSAQIIGPWVGGALVDVIPLGVTGAAGPYFFMAAAFLIAGILVVTRVKEVQRVKPRVTVGSVVSTTVQGLKVVAGNRAAIGALGITMLFNFFYFSYMPLVPVFARDVLHVGPTLMGLLGGAQGMGALAGSTFIATRSSIRRNSQYYLVGTLLGTGCLFVFALSPFYVLSFVALIGAGLGVAAFATMQPTLVLLSVSEEMRGRAMGIVNMAIGALPLGMLAVGGLAEWLGPGTAVAITSSLGFVCIALWYWRSKEMQKL